MVDRIDLSSHTKNSKSKAKQRTSEIYFRKEEAKELVQQDSMFIYDNNEEALANYMEIQPQSSNDFADLKEL